ARLGSFFSLAEFFLCQFAGSDIQNRALDKRLAVLLDNAGAGQHPNGLAILCSQANVLIGSRAITNQSLESLSAFFGIIVDLGWRQPANFLQGFVFQEAAQSFITV